MPTMLQAISMESSRTNEQALTDQWKRTQAYGVDTLTAVSLDAISGQRIDAHRELQWILPPHAPATALLTMLLELMMFANFDYSQLLDCAHGRLFGNSNARLPAPGMLMVDRIVRIDDDGGNYGKGQIHAELDIRPDLWFFDVHFEGDPVMPGCLGLDAMWQLVGFFLAWQGLPGRGRALGAGAIKFFGQVLPSAKVVSYYIDIKRVVRQRLNLAIGDARMLVDGREIYQASDLRVGLFTSTASL